MESQGFRVRNYISSVFSTSFGFVWYVYRKVVQKGHSDDRQSYPAGSSSFPSEWQHINQLSPTPRKLVNTYFFLLLECTFLKFICLWWNNVFITVESQPLSCSKPVILTCLCLILRMFLMPLGCSCLNPHGQTTSQSENMARCSKREKGAHWTKRRVIKEQHSILQCHDWVGKKNTDWNWRCEHAVWKCCVH